MSKSYNFFLDIDGTLLARGSTILTPAVSDALSYARSRGCKIFLNTGRTLAFLPYSLKTSDCFDGFCCGCGTYIEYQGKPILEHYLTTEQLVAIFDEFHRLEMDSDIIFEGKDRMFYSGTVSQWHIDYGFIKVESSDYFRELKFAPKVNKLSIHSKQEKREKFFDALANEFYTMKFPTYCETVPLGFDKGRAIQLVEELLGLDPKCSVAVGDSLNDEMMLKYAATSVAMGNAPDEVKAMCDIVTDTVQNDGVAKIIYSLLDK